jgi:hypothetical protein
MADSSFGLPRQLGDSLLLRWATPDDVEELADFNVRMHSDNPDEPEESIGLWTRDLMSGVHPTTSAGDFTVVVDVSKQNRIVSSLNLISQRWTYDGVPFNCGRPELVGTDPDYRERGLVRQQMEAVHAKSAGRGEMVTAITGIPWFYRQFGYEMALDLGGGKVFFWQRRGNYKPVKEAPYRMRAAALEDIPELEMLYPRSCADSLIVRIRDETLWRYEMTVAHRETGDARQFYMIETAEKEVVAYVEYRLWGQRFFIREFGVKPGHSWREICLFLTRSLKEQADRLNKEREKPIDYLFFNLGQSHPVFDAMGRQLERQEPPYAWYVRLPDIPGFLRHVTPVLERRLAASVMAGHTGDLRLNLFRQRITLKFVKGAISEIGSYEAKHLAGGDAVFPDLSFLQLLFGYRSYKELSTSLADFGSRSAEAPILLNILFPKKPSQVVQLG